MSMETRTPLLGEELFNSKKPKRPKKTQKTQNPDENNVPIYLISYSSILLVYLALIEFDTPKNGIIIDQKRKTFLFDHKNF